MTDEQELAASAAISASAADPVGHEETLIARSSAIDDISITLGAAVDAIIPPDDWPGGWAGGARDLLEEHAGDFLAPMLSQLRTGCHALDESTARAHGVPFADVSPERRRAVLDGLAGHDGVEGIAALAFQGFYAGTRAPAGWRMLGYDPTPTAPDQDQTDRGIRPADLATGYDVIVVGGGAAGGVVAAELSQKGAHVLVVERGRPASAAALRGNHLQGKRAQAYDPTAGPGSGNPRVLEGSDGTTTILPGEGDGGAYGLVAMTLGGGTRLWQGMSWRFLEEDFAMASTYGRPEGSTLADWPFSYDELEPYYSRVEWELGVSGDSESPVALRSRRSRTFPMPALPGDDVSAALTESAARLGWRASSIPFAINSVPRDGRPACVSCGQCVGHACPVDAKNGSQNTFLPRAIATGRCDVLLSAQVTTVIHDGRGVATGVRAIVETEDGVLDRVISARQVVVTAGAVETARLLLASGLGNEWVGRNHHTHGIAVATALAGPPLKTRTGTGHSVATIDWVHRGGAAWGGGVIFDAPTMYPYGQAEFGRLAAGLRWGAEHKRWMRETAPPLGTMSMVQEIPDRSSRVSIEPSLRDRHGMPAARLRGEVHPATRDAVEFMRQRCVEWLEASGGSRVFSHSLLGAPQGAEHSAGTVRMSADPAEGACSPEGLLYGTQNVFVADASLHPTNGGFNPGLTVMANAMRVGVLLDIVRG